MQSTDLGPSNCNDAEISGSVSELKKHRCVSPIGFRGVHNRPIRNIAPIGTTTTTRIEEEIKVRSQRIALSNLVKIQQYVW